MLNSTVGIPTMYEQLHVAPGWYDNSGLDNVDIGLLQVGYNKGDLHWFYQGDVFTPATGYSKSAALNVGQHNFAVAPVGGFTWLPKSGAWEASSKVDYIVNLRDTATNYTSGNELTWEYVAMREVSKKAVIGLNGYLYQQTTDDVQNGAVFNNGNRGRDLSIGPECRLHIGHAAIAFKYFRDTLVENKPKGNAFWFEMGMPLGLHLGR
jgi:hypothetical protein